MGLLDGRVALVTGGGRGIGREHCLMLATEGARVVVNDPGVGLNGEASAEDPADSVVAEIRAAGGNAVADKGSVTKWSDVSDMISQAVDTYGRLDVVVNNAGILRDRMITSLTSEDFDAVIDVHLKGTFSVVQQACVYWRSETKAGAAVTGRIINTTSSSGMLGNIGQAPYASAKAGIIGLTLVTAMEMERYGVTCNAISPVATTRMTSGLRRPTGDPNAEADGFDPRDPKSSSPVVAYLASEAAGWISGQVFRIEGGTVIRMQGWQKSAQRLTTRSGGFLDPSELVSGARVMFGAFPAPFTSPVK